MGLTYVDHIINHTPYECVRNYSRHKPLIENLSQIFTRLCKNFRLLYNFENCLHLFTNSRYNEIHYLSTTTEGLSTLNKYGLEQIYYTYKDSKLENKDFNELLELINCEKIQLEDAPITVPLHPLKLAEIVQILGIQEEYQQKDKGVLIPFNFGNLNLGVFIMWGARKNDREIVVNGNDKLHGWIASTYNFLREFFISEFEIQAIEETYLPSLYASRWKQVAILFANIKNFSPLTEKLRYMYSQTHEDSSQIFREILNKHCMNISQRISEDAGGRVARFFGPGVMAIFGEHDERPDKAAASAVYAATLIFEEFQKLKPEFLGKVIGEYYEIEYNDAVNVNLSVGIDFGTVLFEYLGDENHRKYTAIGDHVNFAEKLMNEALGYSENGQRRPPILVSPTVERCARAWIDNPILYTLHEDIEGSAFSAYGVETKKFRRDTFEDCLKGIIQWDDAWINVSAPPPSFIPW